MIDFAGSRVLMVGVGSQGVRGSSLHLLVAVSQSWVPLGALLGVPPPLSLAGEGRYVGVLMGSLKESPEPQGA